MFLVIKQISILNILNPAILLTDASSIFYNETNLQVIYRMGSCKILSRKERSVKPMGKEEMEPQDKMNDSRNSGNVMLGSHSMPRR